MSADRGENAERERPDVESSSEDYARRFAGEVGAFLLEVQARTTLELIARWPGASVLDVGGGHGQLARPLVDSGRGPTIFGSDAACRARVARWVEAGRARFVAGDLARLPFADGAFDVVVAYRLLTHLRRWPEFIGELTRVARRAVLVDYPTRRSVNAVAEAFFGLKKRVERNTRPFQVFRDRDVEAAFAARGCRVTARRPEFLLPMALHRALRSAGLSRGLEAAAAALGLTRALGSPVILRAEPRG
jgi:2-polyprenyl-3-methyl-5-hydroxy-6-metoxy-1,4-benzoquinol methylase